MVRGRTSPAVTGEAVRMIISASTSGNRGPRGCLGGRSGVLRNLLNGHLQHGHSLPFTELRHQHVASIWKFDRIMVAMRNIRVDRAEFSYPEIDGFRPNPPVVVFDIFGERQFGPGKHADRYSGVAFGCEAARRCSAERRGNQRLSNFGGTRCYSVQTIVTHRIAPRSRWPPRAWSEAQASIKVDSSLRASTPLAAIVRRPIRNRFEKKN